MGGGIPDPGIADSRPPLGAEHSEWVLWLECGERAESHRWMWKEVSQDHSGQGEGLRAHVHMCNRKQGIS